MHGSMKRLSISSHQVLGLQTNIWIKVNFTKKELKANAFKPSTLEKCNLEEETALNLLNATLLTVILAKMVLLKMENAKEG